MSLSIVHKRLYGCLLRQKWSLRLDCRYLCKFRFLWTQLRKQGLKGDLFHRLTLTGPSCQFCTFFWWKIVSSDHLYNNFPETCWFWRAMNCMLMTWIIYLFISSMFRHCANLTHEGHVQLQKWGTNEG